MALKTALLRAFAVAAMLVAAGVPERLIAYGYVGCAEYCYGSFCGGSKGGNFGCMEAAGNTCVLYSTSLCPP